jgi:hypothetical protein
MGLWDTPGVAQVLEGSLFLACFAVYLRTPAGKGAGLKPWVLAAVLLAIQIANAVGPPPPSMEAIAWVGQAQWLLVAAAYWADRPSRGRRSSQAAVGGGPFGAGR